MTARGVPQPDCKACVDGEQRKRKRAYNREQRAKNKVAPRPEPPSLMSCSGCGEEKGPEDFHKDRGNAIGLRVRLRRSGVGSAPDTNFPHR